MGTVTVIAACVEKGSEICAQPAAVNNDHFTVIVTALVAGFSALLTFLGVLVQRQNKTIRRTNEAVHHAAAASDGINNHHPINFRIDLDQKFERVFTTMGEMNGKLSVLSGRLDDVEKTQEGGHHAASQKTR